MQCEECKTEITRNADGDERCSCFFNGELTAIGRVTGLVSTHIAEALKRVASETDNNEGYRDGSVMYDELYCQHQDDTSTDALLIIEVKDMTSVPVIRYKGKEVTGNIVVDYHWTTKNGEGIGEHEYELKHVVQSNSKQVPAIKTVSEKVNAKYFKAVKRDTPPIKYFSLIKCHRHRGWLCVKTLKLNFARKGGGWIWIQVKSMN